MELVNYLQCYVIQCLSTGCSHEVSFIHALTYFDFSFITVREIIVFGINLYIDAITSFRVGVRFFFFFFNFFAIFRNLHVAAKPALGLS